MNGWSRLVMAFSLAVASAAQGAQAPTGGSASTAIPQSKLAVAPQAEPSLNDLGFSNAEVVADPNLQAQLDKRSSMLRTHQILGLVTAVPLVAEYFVGGNTADKIGNGSRNTALHAGLGITTFGLYATTAGYAIFAPKPAGVMNTGSTNLHRNLAWIHGPLMVITPILGAIANDRVQHGKDPGSIGELHGMAATSLLVSYLAAMSIMVLDF